MANMTLTDYTAPIPLHRAVFCETCQCITESKGHACEYCGAPTLMSMARVLGRTEEDMRVGEFNN